jgi:hypothetical protein
MLPMKKSGHTYSFQESGLQYSSPQARELLLAFDQPLKLRHSTWTGALSLRGPEGKVPLSPLSPEEQRTLLLEFFQRWKASHPEEAKKAAFDYIDAQKGFVGVTFVACLFFSLPLSVALFADSQEQISCSRELKAHSAMGTMEVTKLKRDRKGHYLLSLRLTTPDGTVINGTDQVIAQNDLDIPKQIPVIYSPENPGCWSLTPNLSGTEVNWAKRRFFGTFTLLFGVFFLFASLFGIAWSLLRWKRKRPFRQEIAALFSL